MKWGLRLSPSAKAVKERKAWSRSFFASLHLPSLHSLAPLQCQPTWETASPSCLRARMSSRMNGPHLETRRRLRLHPRLSPRLSMHHLLFQTDVRVQKPLSPHSPLLPLLPLLLHSVEILKVDGQPRGRKPRIENSTENANFYFFTFD